MQKSRVARVGDPHPKIGNENTKTLQRLPRQSPGFLKLSYFIKNRVLDYDEKLGATAIVIVASPACRAAGRPALPPCLQGITVINGWSKMAGTSIFGAKSSKIWGFFTVFFGKFCITQGLKPTEWT